MYFIWKDEYNSGIEEIDYQHKKLVMLINELSEAEKKKESPLVISGILERLVDNAITHFAAEKEMLNGIPSAQDQIHQKERYEFTEKVMEFRARQQNENQFINCRSIEYLKNWTLNHILEVSNDV
jgi:hemerythrin-like metal-binding domain